MKARTTAFFMTVLLGLGVSLWISKRPVPQRVPYSVTKSPYAASKYDEYEEELSGKKKGRLQKEVRVVRGSLQRLLQGPMQQEVQQEAVPAPKAKARAKSAKRPEQYIYSVRAGNERGKARQQDFVRASAYNEQVIHEGEAVVVRLEEACQAGAARLPPGTLLYGRAHLRGGRVLVELTAASHGAERRVVRLRCYDSDFLEGIAYDGSRVLEAARDRLLGKAVQRSTSGWLRELGGEAVGAWKEMNKAPIAVLEGGRPLYVQPSKK